MNQFLWEQFLNEHQSIYDSVRKKYSEEELPQPTLDYFAHKDPSGHRPTQNGEQGTPKYAYLVWMVTQFVNRENITNEAPEGQTLPSYIAEIARLFEHNKSKMKGSKEIRTYSFDQALEAIQHAGLSNRETKKQKKLEGAAAMYEDEDYLMLHIQKEEAACRYGSGTTWCIAATKGNNLFNSYAGSAHIVYILFKKPYNGQKDFKFSLSIEKNSGVIEEWKAPKQEHDYTPKSLKRIFGDDEFDMLIEKMKEFFKLKKISFKKELDGEEIYRLTSEANDIMEYCSIGSEVSDDYGDEELLIVNCSLYLPFDIFPEDMRETVKQCFVENKGRGSGSESLLNIFGDVFGVYADEYELSDNKDAIYIDFSSEDYFGERIMNEADIRLITRNLIKDDAKLQDPDEIKEFIQKLSAAGLLKTPRVPLKTVEFKNIRTDDDEMTFGMGLHFSVKNATHRNMLVKNLDELIESSVQAGLEKILEPTELYYPFEKIVVFKSSIREEKDSIVKIVFMVNCEFSNITRYTDSKTEETWQALRFIDSNFQQFQSLVEGFLLMKLRELGVVKESKKTKLRIVLRS